MKEVEDVIADIQDHPENWEITERTLGRKDQVKSVKLEHRFTGMMIRLDLS